MSKEMLGALDALEQEKGVKKEIVIEALKQRLFRLINETTVKLKMWKLNSIKRRVTSTFMLSKK